MKKISVNNLIKFRKKTEKNQKSFLTNLIKDGEIKSEGGGNYWVRSLSAISKAFKLKDTQPIKEKITDILEDYHPKLIKQTKDMYQRNLDILYNYEDFDFSEWLPNDSEIISKTNKKSIIYINTIPVQIIPNQIYSFEKNGVQNIGGVWFVAKIEGYKEEELGMFAEALFIYLTSNFENHYVINPENCLIVDVLNLKEITYKKIIDNEVPAILNPILETMKKII